MADKHTEPVMPGIRRNLRPRRFPSNTQVENGKDKSEEKDKSEVVAEGEKNYICETCGAKFEFKQSLARHKHHHRKNREVGRCYFCDIRFNSLPQLHQHLPTCAGRLKSVEPKRREPKKQCDSKHFESRELDSKQHESRQNDSKQGESEECEPTRHEIHSVTQDDASSIDPSEDMEDVDFVLNDEGDIEATQRTLEEMRQREIKFVENLWELLALLLDGKNKSRILDNQKPVAQILEAVIVECGHEPIRATGTYTSRLRENCKLLFKIAVGPSVEKMLATKPIEGVLEDVIKMGKNSVKMGKNSLSFSSQEVIDIDSVSLSSQEVIVLDSDSDG